MEMNLEETKGLLKDILAAKRKLLFRFQVQNKWISEYGKR